MNRRDLSLAVAALAAVAVTATFVASAFSASPETPRTAANCPKNVVGGSSVYVALTAARHLLIDGKTITTGGVTRRLTIQNTPIHAIVSLAPEPDRVAGAAALKKIAVRRCGGRVASASWGVEIYYGEVAVLSAAANQAFVVKTQSGWRTY
jgi:hypothetical protein